MLDVLDRRWREMVAYESRVAEAMRRNGTYVAPGLIRAIEDACDAYKVKMIRSPDNTKPRWTFSFRKQGSFTNETTVQEYTISVPLPVDSDDHTKQEEAFESINDRIEQAKVKKRFRGEINVEFKTSNSSSAPVILVTAKSVEDLMVAVCDCYLNEVQPDLAVDYKTLMADGVDTFPAQPKAEPEAEATTHAARIAKPSGRDGQGGGRTTP